MFGMKNQLIAQYYTWLHYMCKIKLQLLLFQTQPFISCAPMQCFSESKNTSTHPTVNLCSQGSAYHQDVLLLSASLHLLSSHFRHSIIITYLSHFIPLTVFSAHSSGGCFSFEYVIQLQDPAKLPINSTFLHSVKKKKVEP